MKTANTIADTIAQTTAHTTQNAALGATLDLRKKLTPLMQQYWDVKSAHPDKIILFRMGDFFEMFHRDAELAAPVLGIALTSRNKKAQDETPMCGMPHHSVAPSINKLLAAGYKIAICDQLEDPKFAKGLVKRGITRVLTPGMVFDAETLDASISHYLAAWDETGTVAFFDVTTGEGFYFKGVSLERRAELICSLQAVEIVVAERVESEALTGPDSALSGLTISLHPHLDWISADGQVVATDQIATDQRPIAVQRLLSYAISQYTKEAAEQWLMTLPNFEERRLQGRLQMAPSTIRHLELFETYKGEKLGSLFHAIDRTRTSGGARLLKNWLQFPLMEEMEIIRRQDRIEKWMATAEQLKAVGDGLKGVGDMPRRLGKISQPSRGPRDLVSLAQSGRAAFGALSEARAVTGEEIPAELLEKADAVFGDIERVLVDEPPLLVRAGGVIRSGVNAELDEWVRIATNSNQLILDLEAREKELTGISSLKIRYNNVFGYAIEVTNTHREKVPRERYQRKQTLVNAERYTTDALSEIERKVLASEEKRLRFEEEEFNKLVSRVLAASTVLLEFSRIVSELDVITGFARLAREERYVRPSFHEGRHLSLKASRHPVIELLIAKPFVANDIEIQPGGCLLLTGPNMAGKSTLMRQVAIAVLMAQVGCFVPAKEAKLPIIDRISTRIGASDHLSEGLSTFMVEMKETAEMLATATDRSLLILDEIGRGTSTFDGMCLAQGILEHILKETQCLTLFATHYHELTVLADTHLRLQNVHMAIHEQGGVITFLHRLLLGAAGQSYGIHVARLAGLPRSITVRAEEILNEIDDVGRANARAPFGRKEKVSSAQQLSLLAMAPAAPALSAAEQRILEELRSFNIENSTPLKALVSIADWVKLLGP